MRIIDAWGNEFYNEDEARQFWANQFWDWMDVEFLSEHFELSFEIADWIFSNHIRWEDFKKDFKDTFDEAIEEYIKDCDNESEIIYDDDE